MTRSASAPVAPDAAAAITRLATAVISVKPLVEALPPPIRVVPVAAGDGGSGEVLDRVARHAGVAGLTVAPDLAVADLTVFERLVSGRLALADGPAYAGSPADVDRIAAAVAADAFDTAFGRRLVRSADGVAVRAYGGGAGDEAIVLVPACGMPAALTEPWMRHLATHRRVVTWESRGLFGADGHRDEDAVHVEAQADDLFAVLDAYGVARAHVIGLCGGSVIALAAAARDRDRITSLSLWHGAYSFTDGGPRTRHQNDIMELMEIAALGRSAARSVHSAFGRAALSTIPTEIAHFLVYPFVSPELFYRYCRLNGSLARTGVDRLLPRVTQPALVVTSDDDETAHPDGSRRVAAGLLNSRLSIREHGDHTSLFRADPALIDSALDVPSG